MSLKLSRATDVGPLVSFIVASYNYEKLIGKTIGSILAQTYQNLEIVVVDDASTDNSREIVRSFFDSRVRLHVNDKTIGPGLTYNRGAQLARGKYISYLDADDWIDPRKVEHQLEFYRLHPEVEIVGTYVRFMGADGMPHPLAADNEAHVNQPRDFNLSEAWIVRNDLNAASAMLMRSIHDRIGFRDPDMIYADFEFWTRACAERCRFGLVEIPLTYYRLHEQSAGQRITPMSAFLEVSYLLQKNLSPLIDNASAMLMAAKWIATHHQYSLLTQIQRYRLLGYFFGDGQRSGYAAFNDALLSEQKDPERIAIGKRWHDLLRKQSGTEIIEQDIERYLASRNLSRRQSINFYDRLRTILGLAVSEKIR